MRKLHELTWVLAATLILSQAFLASCTKDGDTIYQPDPDDQASTAPLVTVIYDPNGVGDQSYNDLIYQGVERAARQYGLRTMQLSPTTKDEGLTYLQTMFQAMDHAEDTIRRLFIVAGAGYDDYLRRNNSRLESNPYTDLLYLDTDKPLEGKGSTFYMPYYGAMYEAGAVSPAEATEVLLIGANPLARTVAEAVQGFSDGFQSSPVAPVGQPEKKIVTAWLSGDVSGGFIVSDTTAMRLMQSQQWLGDHHLLVPVCGGSATSFRRFCEMLGTYYYAGIDCTVVSAYCNFSIVKYIDRAILQCVEQWLSPAGMPKHQTFGLADGYTGVVIHPYTDESKNSFAELLSDDLRQKIHQEAIRKEAEYEK